MKTRLNRKMEDKRLEDIEVGWRLLTAELLRQCNYFNHHFRCATGEVTAVQRKHFIHIFVHQHLLLAIGKGTSATLPANLFGFAVHLRNYAGDELETHILTMDNNKKFSLARREQKIEVEQICRQLLLVLCTADSRPTLADI